MSATNDPSKAFISAGTSDNKIYATTTSDISYHVIKANILDYGDTNAYRFRIRAINNQSKIPGKVIDMCYNYIRAIAPPTEIMVQDYSTNYTDAKGYYVDLNQDTNKIYIRHIVPPVRDMIIDGNNVNSTQTNDYKDKIHFKGYFVEYQTLDILDSSINHSDASINSYFDTQTFDWSFVSFNTVANYSNNKTTISGTELFVVLSDHLLSEISVESNHCFEISFNPPLLFFLVPNK